MRLKSLAYAGLDLLTRPWGIRRTINGRRVHLSARCFRAFPAVFEEDVARFLDATVRRGMTVADVGAHIGIHTLALAERVGPEGHVYAFEPAPQAVTLLRRHVLLNRIASRVTVVDLGVGDADEWREMYVDREAPDPGNSFVRRPYVGSLVATPVRTVTLSSFFAGEATLPDVVKVDTEGYEARVLRGCTGLIERRPGVVLVCALHPWHLRQLGDTEERFFALASDLGLRVLDLEGREARPTGLNREVVVRKRERS